MPAATYKCVNHAISVMRLALGYSWGLPAGWFYPGVLLPDGVDLFKRAFPEHAVHFFVPDDAIGKFAGAGSFSQMKFLDPDEYLWAFAYEVEGAVHHFVIGLPVVREGKVQAASVLAVSLGKGR